MAQSQRNDGSATVISAVIESKAEAQPGTQVGKQGPPSTGGSVEQDAALSFGATLREAAQLATQVQRPVGDPGVPRVDERSEVGAEGRRGGRGSGGESGVTEGATSATPAAAAGSSRRGVATVVADEVLRRAGGDGRLSKSGSEAGAAGMDAGGVRGGVSRAATSEDDAVAHVRRAEADGGPLAGRAGASVAGGEDLKAARAKSAPSPVTPVEGRVVPPKAGVKANAAGAPTRTRSVAGNAVTVHEPTSVVKTAADAATVVQAEVVGQAAAQGEVAAGAQSEPLSVSELPVVSEHGLGAVAVDSATPRAREGIASGHLLGDRSDSLRQSSGISSQTTAAKVSATVPTRDSVARESEVSQSPGAQSRGAQPPTRSERSFVQGAAGDADEPQVDGVPALVTPVVGGVVGGVDFGAAPVVPLSTGAGGTASRSGEAGVAVELRAAGTGVPAAAGSASSLAAQQRPAIRAVARHAAPGENPKLQTSAVPIGDSSEGTLSQEGTVRATGDGGSGLISDTQVVVARTAAPDKAVTQSPTQGPAPVSVAGHVTVARETEPVARTNPAVASVAQEAEAELRRGEVTRSAESPVAGERSAAGKVSAGRDAAVAGAPSSSAIVVHVTEASSPVAGSGPDAGMVNAVGGAHGGAAPMARDGGATAVGVGTGTGLAVASSGGVSSSTHVEGMVPAEAHRTLVATPTVLEVGVPNGTQGWVKIRAEVSSEGQVNASLAAGSSASQEMLHRQLPALNAYLHSEQITVTATVTERSFGSSAGAGGGPGQFQSSAGGAAMGDTAHRAGGGDAANLGARSGGREEIGAATDASLTSGYDSRAGLDAGLDAGLGEAGVARAGLHENGLHQSDQHQSGQWLNVRV